MPHIWVTHKGRDPVLHVNWRPAPKKGFHFWLASSQYFAPTDGQAHKEVVGAVRRRHRNNEGQECGRAVSLVIEKSKGGGWVPGVMLCHLHADQKLVVELALDPKVPHQVLAASLNIFIRGAREIQAALRDGSEDFEMDLKRQHVKLIPLLGSLGLKEISRSRFGPLGGVKLVYAPGQLAVVVASRAKR